MLGTVGGQNHMDTTVISDAVNLASPVEGLTKTYGVALLITQQTFNKLANPRNYAIRMIAEITALCLMIRYNSRVQCYFAHWCYCTS